MVWYGMVCYVMYVCMYVMYVCIWNPCPCIFEYNVSFKMFTSTWVKLGEGQVHAYLTDTIGYKLHWFLGMVYGWLCLRSHG